VQRRSKALYAGALQDIDLRVRGNIQKLRKQKGITQDQLAELSGLNRAHVYRLETGRQSMTLRTLKIIGDALEVRPTQLLKGF
jgi:transcriptional regulator with XRE-family HTH domain